MATRNLSDDFMGKVIEDLAWKGVSRDLHWSEQLLEKYKDKVDWKEISSNYGIFWSSSMLEKFKDLIDWEELSDCNNEALFVPDILERFKSYWNWSNLSSNRCIKFTRELLDKFVDKWDWEKLISNWNLEDFFDSAFLKEYNKYIPAASLQSSNLWDKLVDQKRVELINEIIIS